MDIWLRSVKATHTFLTDKDIQSLLPEVRDLALPNLELWVLCSEGRPIGFLGLSGSKVEALFVAPESLRLGGGRMLLDHARRLKGSLAVDVNEQNPDAVRFYEACGFTITGRSEVDSSGRPFPLLHMHEDAI
jgi:putative acetyltransferase